MNEIIRSRQHPLCKLARALHSIKSRREYSQFLAEGDNALEAALNARWPLRCVLSVPHNESAALEKAREARIKIREVEAEVLSSLCEAKTAPSTLTIAHAKPESERDENALSRVLAQTLAASTRSANDESRDHDFTLILDGLGDPGNVGALLRSADAAGVSRIALTPQSADAFSPRAVRSAAGSVFHLPPFEAESQKLVKMLRDNDVKIAVAVAHGGEDLFHVKWPQHCALVLGHETRGISRELENAADLRITIPVFGRAESLNVAAAGAILLYAWRAAQTKNAP